LIYYNNTIDILSNYYDYNNSNKDRLFDKYMKIVNKKPIKMDESDSIKYCSNCDKDKILRTLDGCMICKNCGDLDYLTIDNNKQNYKDSLIDKKVCLYKRINHLSEILNQI
jgi:ribosomal protein L37AE/L43A